MNDSSFSPINSSSVSPSPITSPANKALEALQIAKQMFMQTPDWVTFFREILGIGGVARRLFPTQEEFLGFEQTAQFSEIQTMVSALRNKKGSSSDGHEPTRVITVRLPKSLHEALRAEAHDHKTSMNKLCIAKLLQVLEEEEAGTVTYRPATNPAPSREMDMRPQTSPIPQASPNSSSSPFGQ